MKSRTNTVLILTLIVVCVCVTLLAHVKYKREGFAPIIKLDKRWFVHVTNPYNYIPASFYGSNPTRSSHQFVKYLDRVKIPLRDGSTWVPIKDAGGNIYKYVE